MHRWIFIFLLMVSGLFSRELSLKNFLIRYDDRISPLYLDELIDHLESCQNFFQSRFEYQPQEVLPISIFSSVNLYTEKLNIPYWIGGYYINGMVFLQPLDRLKQKEVLTKIIFIEYTHYFIDQYTVGMMPGWLNELVCLYYYPLYQPCIGQPLSVKDQPLLSYLELTDIKNNIRDSRRMQRFIDTSSRFCRFLTRHYGHDFIGNLLTALHSGQVIDTYFLEKTGMKLEAVYQQFYSMIK